MSDGRCCSRWSCCSPGAARTLAGLNHLTRPAGTGGPAEYGSIETTVDPAALTLVTTWLTERFG